MLRKSIEIEHTGQIISSELVFLQEEHLKRIRNCQHLHTPSPELTQLGARFHSWAQQSLVDSFIFLVASELPSFEIDILTLLQAPTVEEKLGPLFGNRLVNDPASLASVLMYISYEISGLSRVDTSQTALRVNECHFSNKAKITVYDQKQKGYSLSKSRLKTRHDRKELKNMSPYTRQDELLTHATYKEEEKIFGSGILSRYGALGPVCLSRDCVSLVESEGVFIFEPKVLREAGYSLWCVDENPKDAKLIKEVRTYLPIPLFLASGFMHDQEFPFDDVSKMGSFFADQRHDSCSRGIRRLEELKWG